MEHAKIKKSLRSLAALAMISLPVASLSQPTQGDQTGPRALMSNKDFLAGTQKAQFADYAKRPGAKVANEKEFTRMKNHILTMYEGVVVKNSFVMEGNGQIDCIDAKTQPSLRRNGKQLTIQKPPSIAIGEERPQEKKAEGVPPMLSQEKKDRFGNAMYCENGFIPLRRITLDEMTRFATLDDFFNKFGKAGTSGIPQRK